MARCSLGLDSVPKLRDYFESSSLWSSPFHSADA